MIQEAVKTERIHTEYWLVQDGLHSMLQPSQVNGYVRDGYLVERVTVCEIRTKEVVK